MNQSDFSPSYARIKHMEAFFACVGAVTVGYLLGRLALTKLVDFIQADHESAFRVYLNSMAGPPLTAEEERRFWQLAQSAPTAPAPCGH